MKEAERLAERLEELLKLAEIEDALAKYFIKNGFAGQLLDDKKNHLADIFAGFSPNPDVEEVNRLGEHLRKEKIDFIVALGGGSVIDGAKAASVLIEKETSIRKYHNTGEKVPKKHLPLIAIPTTAGTGRGISVTDTICHIAECSSRFMNMCDSICQ